MKRFIYLSLVASALLAAGGARAAFFRPGLPVPAPPPPPPPVTRTMTLTFVNHTGATVQVYAAEIPFNVATFGCGAYTHRATLRVGETVAVTVQPNRSLWVKYIRPVDADACQLSNLRWTTTVVNDGRQLPPVIDVSLPAESR